MRGVKLKRSFVTFFKKILYSFHFRLTEFLVWFGFGLRLTCVD